MYICVRATVITEEAAITSRTLRRTRVGEKFKGLEAPVIDNDDLDLQRVKCTAQQDNAVGWVTIRGNIGWAPFLECYEPRTALLSMHRRLVSMLGQIERYADVVFVVGSEPVRRFPAVKLLFAQASEVFDRMLFPDSGTPAFPEQARCSEVRIVDISAEAFEQLQLWAYGLQPALTCKNAFAVAKAADKYSIAELQQEVDTWVSESLTNVEMALGLFDAAISAPWPEVLEPCISAVCKSSALSLESDAFVSLSKGAVSGLLDEDRFKVNEEKLFTRCIDWANKNEAEGVKAIDLLRGIAERIRFPLMSAKFVAERVVPMKVLEDSQALQLLSVLVAGGSCANFVSRKRSDPSEELRCSVLAILQDTSSHSGLELGAIAGALAPVELERVRSCLQALIEDGEVFNTIDSEHFMSLQSNMRLAEHLN